MKSLGAGACGANVCIVVTVVWLAEIAALPCNCNVEGRRGASAGAVASDADVGAVVVEEDDPHPPPPAADAAAETLPMAVVCCECT